MRARNLKPGFFENEDLAELGPYAQLLFEGLWCLADRDGKLEDRPKRIKAQIFPYYEPKPGVENLLEALTKAGFIQRYNNGNLKIIKIINFLKHQHPHNTERKSELPDPSPLDNGEPTANPPLGNGEYRADSLIPDSLNHKLKAYGHRQADDPSRFNGNDMDFSIFWSAYPRKTAKQTALKKWRSLYKQGRLPPVDTLIKAVNQQSQTPQWARDGIIPHASTWLNQERWNDEPPEDHYDRAARLIEGGQLT